MSIVEGWMPPTRENYQLILVVWQILYPFVSIMLFSQSSGERPCKAQSLLTVEVCGTDWFLAICDQVVWNGQDFSARSIESARPHRMDVDGGTRVHHVAVYYENAATDARH
jgi:hypothetical protein